MFLTVDDAKLNLAEYVDPPFIETFATLLDPVAALIAVTGTDAPHRIGGAPRAGEGLVWPSINAAAILPGTLAAGHPEANAANRAHLDASIPMSFVVQIELGALPDLPQLSDLPDQGRLLFFYDFAIGSYENSSQICRVIWDQTDPAALTDIAPPAALTRAADTARHEAALLHAEYDTAADWDGYSTIFAAAARPAQIVTGVELRATPMLGRGDAPAPLMAAIRGETADDAALDMLSQYQDAFYASVEAHRPPLRLRGLPIPEQDDPRYDAVVISTFGKQYLSHEEWLEHRDQIMAEAEDWAMLAQLDVREWLRDSAEGQVYFLIRREDQAARHFDRVVCVYQQT